MREGEREKEVALKIENQQEVILYFRSSTTLETILGTVGSV